MPDDQLTPSTFLLGELRRARTAAGLSQEEFGKAINYSASLVSAVENGQRPPAGDYLAAVDSALDTGGLFERLSQGLAGFGQTPVWFRDWLIIEREATLIRWFEPLVVPGLLQTKAYAHAIIAGSGVVDAVDVDQWVTTRLERQDLLSAPKPPTLIAIIDEGVLRRCVGSRAIMAEQCEFLLESAAQSHIQIHMIPSSAGAHAGLAGAFTLAKARDFEAAHLDGQLDAQITGHRDEIDRLSRTWEQIRGESLPKGLSLRLIEDVAKTWQI
ncbi:helix-turn-helix domain-containing protein [Paractinoplanes durhamensis]|uniref:Transcriptional regulator n=1 Tax=Paractinoplanes durhamensis TaxID=113563 RepID=A0ABQ3Z2M3_9ACTN|nr:helix-turn-helix transcriptional regulator [Actinoplanes durhamensis]GIE04065.1 transcriptional regulator [Actinoplanes durhamensis]